MTTPTSFRRSFFRGGLLSLLGVTALSAQSPAVDARLATRGQLQAAATVLERSANSPAYGERIRAKARADFSRVQRRLLDGDFHVGERIFLRVDAQETLFSDTLTVLDSVMLDIPAIRRVRLYGVLRSELEQEITTQIGAVVRNVRVSARPLMRVAVLGDIATPGFRAVPTETLVDQLLALGGSPAPTAMMDKIRIVRADTVLFEGPEVLTAIAEGRTLDALNLRDGDAIVVPRGAPPFDRASAIQIVSLFLAPLLTIVLVR